MTYQRNRLPVARTQTFAASGEAKFVVRMVKSIYKQAYGFYKSQDPLTRVKIQVKVTVR